MRGPFSFVLMVPNTVTDVHDTGEWRIGRMGWMLCQIIYRRLYGADFLPDSADIGEFRENFDFKRFLFLPSGVIKTI
ncbi:hypothetical protein AUQ43_13095 [Thalassospira sp. MCCC 1A01148]|uniref:Uncharacterized protein n=1 Tax=Thalassospira profundimaris TaxID=502049 RepID=A0A367VIC3_9PROT|nr:hypothetical protein AUQ43_13095 [Thalassospira sp. MCCC 1A01148]RCK24000.1 hypothetical protein TH6_04580 [Thalassospira profundimaris]